MIRDRREEDSDEILYIEKKKPKFERSSIDQNQTEDSNSRPTMRRKTRSIDKSQKRSQSKSPKKELESSSSKEMRREGFKDNIENIQNNMQSIKIDTVKRGIRKTSIGKEKLPQFDEAMSEFFESNVALTKIFALSLAIKLDLFNILKKNFQDEFVKATDLKKHLKIKSNDRQFISILDKLNYHGYLEKQDRLLESKYRNSDYTDKYFTEDSERDYTFVYSNVERYIEKFLMADATMKSGKVKNILDDLSQNEKQLKNFLDFYTIVNQRNFANLIQHFDFSKYKTVIDVHGTKGDLAMKIKNKYPDVEVISMDMPAVEPHAIEYIRENGMENKIELQFGDIRKDKIPKTEVIIVPHLLQYFEGDDKKKILKSLYNSLEEKGCLIILENLIYEPEKDIEIPANKISLLLALEGYEGDHLTFDEYYEILYEIGFNEIKQYHRDWISFVIVATK
jgi:trans-aconitate methyltransferase